MLSHQQIDEFLNFLFSNFTQGGLVSLWASILQSPRNWGRWGFPLLKTSTLILLGLTLWDSHIPILPSGWSPVGCQGLLWREGGSSILGTDGIDCRGRFDWRDLNINHLAFLHRTRWRSTLILSLPPPTQSTPPGIYNHQRSRPSHIAFPKSILI